MRTNTSSSRWRPAFAATLLVLGLGASSIASAALFEDDEARRAIIELRGRVEAQRAAADRQAEDARRAADVNPTWHWASAAPRPCAAHSRCWAWAITRWRP